MKPNARRLSKWLEPRSRWSQLRNLGESGLVRASVLMPAFGYILLLNDNVHQYAGAKAYVLNMGMALNYVEMRGTGIGEADGAIMATAAFY
jgi:hypothetical protein